MIKKRIIALTLVSVLVLSMVLGFAGCGKKKTESEEPETEQTETEQTGETTQPETQAAPQTEPETETEQETQQGTDRENGEAEVVTAPEVTAEIETEQENEQTEQGTGHETEETGVLMDTIDPDKPMVCLTFDDGPSEYTNEILDLLVEYNAKATFFEVGINIDGHEDALRRELELGMQQGNHTWSHQDLGSISEEEAIQEIEKGKERIYEVTGQYPSVLRPPYGSLNGKAYLIDVPIVTWSVDTEDWKSLDADSVMDMIYAEDTLDGKCILMHSLYGSTVEALRMLLPYLAEQGFQCVTVSEMARYRHGEELQNGEWYGWEYFR